MISVYTASRSQRWVTILLCYNFDIQFRRTSEFGQVDALSRLIAKQIEDSPEEVSVIASLRTIEAEISHLLVDDTNSLPVTADQIRLKTKIHPLFQRVIKSLQTSWPRPIVSPTLQHFFNRNNSLSYINGLLKQLLSLTKIFSVIATIFFLLEHPLCSVAMTRYAL